ncbi:hypothetical protein [Falsirhodobacter deserti]|uniref:hypothetical protein n=1 Tax=Falsirhodobacter deserti TaxID=1365611 RepID=UPI000FE31EE7|nr:hypothetical protein [Falsirhodobacter deserti]
MEDEKTIEARRVALAKIRERLDIDQVTRERLAQQVQQLQVNAKAMMDLFASVARAIQPVLGPLPEFFSALNRYREAKKLLAQSQIMPSRTIPWPLFDEGSPEKFTESVLEHYRQKWAEVEIDLLSGVREFDVSDVAKDAFADALACHRNKLYRSAVLTLFPVLENEYRQAFKREPKGQASLRDLRTAMMEVPIGVAFKDLASYDLIQIVHKHLYAQVVSPESIELFENNLIPNRNAAIHGLVDYNNEISSLNAIFLAEYVLYLIAQIKPYLVEQEPNL